MREVASESGLARTGERSWVFETFAGSLTQHRAGHEVQVFPALVDEGATVGLQVFGSADEAEARHRLGVRRLLLLELPSPVRTVLDGLTNAEKLGLAGSPYPSVAELLEDCRAAVVGAAVDARPAVRDEASYDALLAEAGRDLEAHLRGVLADVMRVLDAWRRAEKALSGRADLLLLPALTDLRAQLDRLVHRGFVGEAGAAQLRRYPTYLAALEQRRARLPDQVNRDRQLLDQVADLQDAYLHQMEALPAGRPPGERLRQVRWMLEEYRVSLWAQQLGTPAPVSDQRIRRALGT